MAKAKISRVPGFRNQYNFDVSSVDNFEFIDSKSLTVPDMSMSIQSLVERHQRGQAILGYHQPPVFNEDVELPEFERMDFADRHAYYETVIATRGKLEAIVNKAKQDISDKQKLAEFEAAVAAEAAKRLEAQNNAV